MSVKVKVDEKVDEKVEGIFHKMVYATEEVLKKLKLPIIEKGLKRKFHAEFDKYENQIIDLTSKIDEKSSKDFENYDVGVIISYRFDITCLRNQQEMVKTEYKFMFGSEMKTEE